MMEVNRPSPAMGRSTQVGPDQYFYGHGKLLLSGEYFVLEGAKALAVPCRFGQSLSVKYSHSFNPTLKWRAYDYEGNLWYQAEFEFWRFNLLDEKPAQEALFIQKILRQARKQNPHFLRDDVSVEAITRLNFPSDWGLGSSSTLIHNIAEWAFTGPFELQFKTLGGSGYDVACAQADGPILYEKLPTGPSWSLCKFHPPFKDKMYFVYLGKKQATAQAIDQWRERVVRTEESDHMASSMARANVPKRECLREDVELISSISTGMLNAQSAGEMMDYMKRHEAVVSQYLGVPIVGQEKFPDFPGAVKSLGAWGGDFALAVSERPASEVIEYFERRGLPTVFSYDDLILPSALEWQSSASHLVNQGEGRALFH